MNIVERFYRRVTGQTVMNLFHGSSGESVYDILDSGVLLAREATGVEAIEYSLPSRMECVYVTKDPSFAEEMALRNVTDLSMPAAVFMVNATADDLYLDEDTVFLVLKRASQEDPGAREYFGNYISQFDNLPRLKDMFSSVDEFLGSSSYPRVNTEIKELTRWIEDNDPVLKAAIMLRSNNHTFCLKNRVDIIDYQMVHDPYDDEYDEPWDEEIDPLEEDGWFKGY